MHDNEFKLCAAIAVGAAVAFIVIGPGCNEKPASPTIFGNSPVKESAVVQSLRHAWETGGQGKSGKDAWAAAQMALGNAVEKAIEDGHLAELERFVEESAKASAMEGFGSELQHHLVFTFMSLPDRSRLVKILSWGSTDYSTMRSIENALTEDQPWNKVSGGLLVLFDAYDLAKTDEAREANWFAVWRALGDLPIKTKDQREYMRVARGWYKENGGRLQRQKGYDHTDFYFAPRETYPGDSRRHLFKLPESIDR